MRVLCVKWIDAMLGGNDWKLLDEIAADPIKTVSVISYGWEVENTKEQIVLATNRAGADTDKEQLSGFIAIPRAAVEHVTVLQTYIEFA